MRKAVWVLPVLALLIAAAAYSGGRGAVEVPLVEGGPSSGSDEVIGWAILNTTAPGEVNVLIHVDAGLPNTEYTAVAGAWFVSPSGPPDVWETGTLCTNRRGKGSARLNLWVGHPYWLLAEAGVIDPVTGTMYYGSAELPQKQGSYWAPGGAGVPRSGVPFGDPSRAGLR